MSQLLKPTARRRWLVGLVAAGISLLLVSGPASADVAPTSPVMTNATSPTAPTTTTTSSTTASTLPSTQATVSDDSSPGLFDVSGHVRKAIDDWFDSLVTSAITPALQLLGRVLLSAPDLTGQSDVHSIWEVTLATSDALMVVFALFGAIIVMTHETVQTRYQLKDIAPRLVIAIISANVSLIIISQAITLANAVALGLLGGIDTGQAVNQLGQVILSSALEGSFFLLLAFAATVLTVVLVCIGLIRAVLVVLLIVSAPLALGCHALPQTDHVASLWWRALAACLSIQIAQALVLVTAVRVILATQGSALLGVGGGGGLVDLLLVLCVFWIMIKIPAWSEKLVFSRGNGPVGRAHNKAWMAAKLAVLAA